MEGVQVESVGNSIITFKARQIALTTKAVTVTPDWKLVDEDEVALKLAQSSIEPSLRPLIGEKNDLALALRNLEGVLPSRVSVSETDSPLPRAAKSAR